MVLLLQPGRARHPGELTEILFADDADLPRLMGVQLLRAPQLVARLTRVVVCSTMRLRTESCRADDEHCRLRGHLVCGRAAEPGNEVASLPATE